MSSDWHDHGLAEIRTFHDQPRCFPHPAVRRRRIGVAYALDEVRAHPARVRYCQAAGNFQVAVAKTRRPLSALYARHVHHPSGRGILRTWRPVCLERDGGGMAHPGVW
jgi:hypothetical protein